MPTATRTTGFARILCISPRLPLSLSSTSVDRNAEVCPNSRPLRFSVVQGGWSRLDVSSNVSATSASRIERSPTSWILLVFSALLISGTGCLYYRSTFSSSLLTLSYLMGFIFATQPVFVAVWLRSPKKGLTFTSSNSLSAIWDRRNIATGDPVRYVFCSRSLLKKYANDESDVPGAGQPPRLSTTHFFRGKPETARS